jgi:hypothetical protein
MYNAVADMPSDIATDNWLHYSPGVRGLENAILEHLVQSRYAAAVAGAPEWGIRSAAEVQHFAGTDHHATLAQTEAALRALEGRGLIVVDSHGDTSGWRASTDGAAAIDHAIDARLPLAA